MTTKESSNCYGIVKSSELQENNWKLSYIWLLHSRITDSRKGASSDEEMGEQILDDWTT